MKNILRGMNMRYKKLVTITLMAILLCTSISATVGGRFSSVEPKNVVALKGRISDFLSNLQSAFPFLAGIIERVAQRIPEDKTPEEPEKRILDFDICIDEQFKAKQPIPVTATLTNNGKTAVTVNEMSLKCRTLDFIIETPSGVEIHYIGPTGEIPEKITIEPGESNSTTIDDITLPGLFGVIQISDSAFTQYHFKDAGIYNITGCYIPGPYIQSSAAEYHKLYSPTYQFELVFPEKP